MSARLRSANTRCAFLLELADGYTLRDAAVAMGVTTQTVLRERRRYPDFDELVKTAQGMKGSASQSDRDELVSRMTEYPDEETFRKSGITVAVVDNLGTVAVVAPEVPPSARAPSKSRVPYSRQSLKDGLWARMNERGVSEFVYLGSAKYLVELEVSEDRVRSRKTTQIREPRPSEEPASTVPAKPQRAPGLRQETWENISTNFIGEEAAGVEPDGDGQVH